MTDYCRGQTAYLRSVTNRAADQKAALSFEPGVLFDVYLTSLSAVILSQEYGYCNNYQSVTIKSCDNHTPRPSGYSTRCSTIRRTPLCGKYNSFSRGYVQSLELICKRRKRTAARLHQILHIPHPDGGEAPQQISNYLIHRKEQSL